MAELLLVRGLAQVVKHRADEERSAHYEALMNAEEAGKRSKKGQWSAKEPPTPRINDLSLPGSAARAKQHLPFLQRGGKLHGVCEHVMSGSRLKVFIPNQSVTLAFRWVYFVGPFLQYMVYGMLCVSGYMSVCV